MGSYALSFPVTRAASYAPGNALLGGGVARNPFVLPAAFGVFNETASDAILSVTLPAAFTLAAGIGAFAETGVNAGLAAGSAGAFTLAAGTGVFNETGDAMTPVIAYTLPAGTGVFTETGNGATLTTAGGGGLASFTFGGNIGSTGAQGTSPFVVSGTFNTGAADIPVVAIVQANDFSGGTITGVSIIGLGTLTCIQGTNNAGEQTWLCYGSPGALATASISIAFTGTILASVATGKVTTTTPTPYSTGNSTAAQGGGVTTPFAVAATTGAGGIPANGVSVGVVGDFFTSGTRTFTSVTPTQDAITNSVSGQYNFAMGHSVTAGSTNGITVAGTTGLFPAWAIVSWGP